MGQFESYQPENMLCKVVHFACCAFSGSFLGASFTWPLEERCYLKVSNFRPVGHISVFKTHKVHLLQNRPNVFFVFFTSMQRAAATMMHIVLIILPFTLGALVL